MKAALLVACIAVAACGHARVSPVPAPAPLVLGARPPPGCEASAAATGCLGWYLDRVLVEIAVTEVPDPALNAYVTGVGLRLARVGGITAPLKFRVIDDLDSQAESFPGGAIYVHRGALLRLRSEAELAALLGHELGHVLGGHLADGPEGVGRDDEIQADEVSVRLVAAAGYDPRAVETMLRAIAAEYPVACPSDDRDDHPCLRDRIARIRARVAGRHTGDLGVERFRAGTASVVTGDDPLRVTATPTALLFGHAGLAFQPGKVRALTIDEGRGLAVLDDDTIVVITAVPRELGALLHVQPPAGQAFAVGERGALWLLVVGTDATARADQLTHDVRPLDPGELDDVHPALFDLAAPRALWPG